ncbi:hypothetical protein BUALT_Bualt01G0185400 [Buddleja alternifolia]|uniref:Uncharacterized protein n=1 Tax=Buddleja alternifolia TaxID=168488 RepID=A0AAV6YFX6_9LAMI|nr:hypothetical protein BUALT_Bualt01G0185400 [Buddleja alternifolia]
MEVQIAGGAADEDRVQAVCSEENAWLFCAIYDGFNGRDPVDFLAGTLYETVAFHLNLLDWDLEHDSVTASQKQKVLDSVQTALTQVETEFLHMVEQEMDDRPDSVSIGSCVLLVLLHGKKKFVLAQFERIQLLNDHPDDPNTIVWGGGGQREAKELRSTQYSIDTTLIYVVAQMKIFGLSVKYLFISTIGLPFGFPSNVKVAAEDEKLLSTSLQTIESFWLEVEGDGPFLLGNSKPSIADLALVCEIIQIEVADENDRERILGLDKKVLKWIEDRKVATSAYFDEIHLIMLPFKEKLNELKGRSSK